MATYITEGGVNISTEDEALPYQDAILPLINALDDKRGALFASSFEYPGRYTCWDIGFYHPPLALTYHHKQLKVDALNERGKVLLPLIKAALENSQEIKIISATTSQFVLTVIPSSENFTEEQRSRQPSVFSAIRLILSLFKSETDPYLGLYGAFGYDLIDEFEQLEKHKARDVNAREMVMYLPDEIWVVNHRKESAFIRRYDFEKAAISTRGLARNGEVKAYSATQTPTKPSDFEPNGYAALVEVAKESFARGDLFEVVPSQTFYLPCNEQPSSIFSRLRTVNPSPYGFLMNLGEGEYLVGASPEMYVRVTGDRVETCPISGTIKRGQDALEDAANIQTLLTSEKEASELTMCTDVDRNDKSRICKAGSVKVLGRRLIEMYSRVIHTVDHVEGILREGFDALDAFLSHMWVVTVTGAPKLWAMKFIEKHEITPRRWYGGAVGWLGFDGNLNTGLVLRTIRIEDGIAEIRVGATLLFDSIPTAEEEETHLKAQAMRDVLMHHTIKPQAASEFEPNIGKNKTILLVDHQDSFVHTLANYFRQTGTDVVTIRFDKAVDYLNSHAIDCVVLSPGPGTPSDFNLNTMIRAAIDKNCPIFGVCLGLQGLVEYFGGSLLRLDYPMHGKASALHLTKEVSLWEGLPKEISIGRYHSLYANPADFPDELEITAKTDDDIIMAIAHKTLPIQAVQFHPETILSLQGQVGLKMIFNWVKHM